MDRTDLRRVLAPNPSALTGTGTNTWIVGRGEVAVIDPGPAIPAHLEAILATLAGDRVTAILITHAHADHTGLAAALAARTGAPVLGFGPAGAGRSAQMQALADSGLAGGGEGADPAYRPDRTLGEGDTVEGGDWRLTALHTPGHDAGHLSFAWGQTLFSGDHVMGWATSIVSPPDGDMAAYMASLTRLQRGGWDRFLPGHGEAIAAPEARLADLIAHRRRREAQVLAALATGPQDVAALTRTVYADTPPALWPAARRNALAHLIDLAQRGLVTASPAPGHDAVFGLV